jgi:hypothetical protein
MAEFFNRIGPNRTFVPTAANVFFEPTLPIFCSAAKVRFRETGEVALLTSAQTGPSLQLGGAICVGLNFNHISLACSPRAVADLS